MDNYDKKMIKIYLNKLKETIRLLRWGIWQKLNRKFLKTYPLIEECARCRDCGRNVHDFSVPDELFIEVIGSDEGVWCYDCFCNRADEKLITKWRMSLKDSWYSN